MRFPVFAEKLSTNPGINKEALQPFTASTAVLEARFEGFSI